MDFGIPQGSTQGAYLFICYASTLNEIGPKSLTLNGFADDYSIRKSFKPAVPNRNGISTYTDKEDTITIIEKSPLDITSHLHRDNNTAPTDNIEHSTFDLIILYNKNKNKVINTT